MSEPTAVDRLILVGARGWSRASRDRLAEGAGAGGAAARPAGVALRARGPRPRRAAARCSRWRPATTRRATSPWSWSSLLGPRRRGAVAHPRRARRAPPSVPRPTSSASAPARWPPSGAPSTVVVAGAPAVAERVAAPQSREPLEVAVGDTDLARRAGRPPGGDRLRAGRPGGGARRPVGARRHPRRLPVDGRPAGPRRAVRRRDREHAGVLAVHPAHHPPDQRACWPGRRPSSRGGDGRSAVASPDRRDAVVVRLAPTEHPAALREAQRAARGRGRRRRAVATRRRSRRSSPRSPRSTSRPPSGAARRALRRRRGAFRHPLALARPRPSSSRLGRAGLRVVVGFARRGDMSRAMARMERLRPRRWSPASCPPPGTIAAVGDGRPRRARLARARRRDHPRGARSCAAAARRRSAARWWASAWPASSTSRSATTSSTRTTASAASPASRRGPSPG